ncbi:hypothetical protein DFH09DRAFT_1094553 [Mycena vulgaris]|nr:hypothetical protein DFH09DRAFT_1094553 [Mycena vulgaris]
MEGMREVLKILDSDEGSDSEEHSVPGEHRGEAATFDEDFPPLPDAFTFGNSGKLTGTVHASGIFNILTNFSLFPNIPASVPQYLETPSSPRLPPLPVSSPASIPDSLPNPSDSAAMTRPARKRNMDEVDQANVIHSARPRKAPGGQ